ncbi:MAG TPA: hypothetical protein VF648_09745 [Pyrinomonadaceae bacterium]|jgi:hypothetical protein
MKTKKQKTATVETVESNRAVKVEIETPATAGEQAATVQVEVTTPAPKSKKSGGKKETKPGAKSADDARENDEKSADENDVKMPSPLKVDPEVLRSKVQALRLKLEQQKRETTKSPFHVQYGYFLARAKSGKILALEFHEVLKGNKWILRDLETKKILTQPEKTMHGLHDKAVREF